MAAPGNVSEGLWSCDTGWWRSPCTQVALSGKAHERWSERRTHQRQDSTPPLLLLMSLPCQATHSCLWGPPLLCSYLKLSFSPPMTPTSSSPSLHVSDIQDSTAATATPFRNRNLPLQSVVILYPITSMKCTNRCLQQETPNPNSRSCVSLRLGVGTTATASSTWRPFHSCEYFDNSHSNHQQ